MRRRYHRVRHNRASPPDPSPAAAIVSTVRHVVVRHQSNWETSRSAVTCLQTSAHSGLNLSEYGSVSSLTLRSTSSRLTFSFLARNGACIADVWGESRRVRWKKIISSFTSHLIYYMRWEQKWEMRADMGDESRHGRWEQTWEMRADMGDESRRDRQRKWK